MKLVLFVLLACSLAFAQTKTKTVAERLGYAADTKLLIIHADDLAVAHSADQASFAALERKAVSSASIMVPCPWFTEVAAYAKQHPDADLGLHLTLTSEWKEYRWGPVAPRDKVPGLLDLNGNLWPDVRNLATHATAEEVEREIRAQVERAIHAGIHPTHLDTHMAGVAAKPEFYAAYARVSREYKMPFMALRQPIYGPAMFAALKDDDIVLDSVIMLTEVTKPEQWKEAYAKAITSLKPGLHEMIVHLGYDNAELQAITEGHPGYGSAWRQRDFDFVTSPAFQQMLEENHIRVVRWSDLKKLIQ